MCVSYKKLWILLAQKEISKAELWLPTNINGSSPKDNANFNAAVLPILEEHHICGILILFCSFSKRGDTSEVLKTARARCEK